MYGGNGSFAPGLDGGLKLHALDHHQRVAGGDVLALFDMDGDHHAGHRRLGDIVGAAAGMAAVALHRVDIADRVGRAIEVDVDEIAIRRDQDAAGFRADAQKLSAAFGRRKRNRDDLLRDVELVGVAAPRQPRLVFGFGDDEGVLHQDAATAGDAGTAQAARYSAASRPTSSPTLGTS